MTVSQMYSMSRYIHLLSATTSQAVNTVMAANHHTEPSTASSVPSNLPQPGTVKQRVLLGRGPLCADLLGQNPQPVLDELDRSLEHHEAGSTREDEPESTDSMGRSGGLSRCRGSGGGTAGCAGAVAECDSGARAAGGVGAVTRREAERGIAQLLNELPRELPCDGLQVLRNLCYGGIDQSLGRGADVGRLLSHHLAETGLLDRGLLGAQVRDQAGGRGLDGGQGALESDCILRRDGCCGLDLSCARGQGALHVGSGAGEPRDILAIEGLDTGVELLEGSFSHHYDV